MESTHTAEMLKALGHPVRVRILTRMNTPRRRLSPRGFCEETGLDLSKVSYHFRALAHAGLITEVDRIPVRGSMKHIYVANDRTEAWAKEYAALPEAVKRAFAATALREAVEAIGRSVDDGGFTSRPESHLSWDSIWVDEDGWGKLAALFDQTLKAAKTIRDECAERMPNPSEEGGCVASYLISSFPSPLPPEEEDRI